VSKPSSDAPDPGAASGGSPTVRRSMLPLAFSAAVLLAVPALAEPLPSTTKAQQVFFHCGATKVANVDAAQGATPPTWDTTAPTASVQAGAGCGWVDPSALRNTQAGNGAVDGSWQGTVTGNLGSLTAQLYSISAGPGRAGGPQSFNVSLTVDGRSMFGIDPNGSSIGRARVTVTPVVSSTQVSALYEFTITGLPFVTEEGDGVKKHDIVLNVAAFSEQLMGWVFDTTEVPSGIAFNPATPSKTVVAAAP
jgi:hypothetical protein